MDVPGQTGSLEDLIAFANSSEDGVWLLDAALTVLHVNREGASVAGLAASQLIGRNLADFAPQAVNSGRFEKYREVARTGVPFLTESVHLTLNPEGLRYSILAMPLACGLGIVVRPQGQGDLAAESVRQVEDRLKGILALTPAAIIVADSGFRISLFSDGAQQIFGYSADEVIGEPVEMLLPEQFRGDHAAQMQRFAQSDDVSRLMNARSEIAGRRKDGTVFAAEASISKLTTGEQQSFTVLLHDVSERKKIEIELREAKEQAEAANTTKSEFLANMSHELRTPLNAVIGFSDVLAAGLAGELTEKQAEYVQDIRSSGEHLLDLINDILDLSRIEAGQLEIEDETLDIREVIRDVLRYVERRARKVEIEIETEIPDPFPGLRADRRRVIQMLLNLVSNSVKFTPRGGRITLSAELGSGSEIVLTVRDTGIGIPANQMAKVMATFGQANTEHKIEGTGLGLPLVRSMAELHGAEFELESDPGTGTTARIVFPPERVL